MGLRGAKPKSLQERFDKHAVKSDGCWSWNGSKHKFGYGWLRENGKTHVAHRISYQLYKGEIPDGKLIMHSCDNPECTNPDHLSLGTDADNIADKVRKNRHCKGSSHYAFGKRAHNALLSNDDIENVVRLFNSGKSRKEIAQIYSVAYETVCKYIKSAIKEV